MSRIDEALKRASQGPVVGRGPSRVAEVPLRRTDELTIDMYPRESRSADEPRPAIEKPALPLSLPGDGQQKAPRPEHSSQVRTGLDSNNKLVVSSRRSAVSLEQYRRLAATLHEAQAERGLKTIMITSAIPREGKTLTAINLALTLSNSYGKKVLLIDGDLRRPSVHDVLGIPNEKGLSDFLRGNLSEFPLITVPPSLSVLPSGPPDQNPQSGLSSERMQALLTKASERFDWVILDTPPVTLLSDAQILSRITHATVLVIRAGFTPLPIVEKAVAEVGRDYIIGTVLNGVEDQAIPATGYYRDYYGDK